LGKNKGAKNKKKLDLTKLSAKISIRHLAGRRKLGVLNIVVPIKTTCFITIICLMPLFIRTKIWPAHVDF